MAEGGQQNQQHQQNVYHINIALHAQQNQRELVQARTTEIAAGNIENIIIPQADEQQAAQNVEQVADNVQPDNIAEGVEPLNLSSKNTDGSQSGAIKKRGESARDKMAQQLQRPLPSPNTAGDGNNPLKISMLRKKSSKFFDESKYEEAAPIFEELQPYKTIKISIQYL
uniref:uncharacterized protein LOC120330244 isoform X2 n=1 Tax=Styela clava TaxID=7725 RepID=UPI0019395DBF|nr:uncharacterized protein LOC120330244 isoform X2 [Styela clava]